jgi:hypothetical protein
MVISRSSALQLLKNKNYRKKPKVDAKTKGNNNDNGYDEDDNDDDDSNPNSNNWMMIDSTGQPPALSETTLLYSRNITQFQHAIVQPSKKQRRQLAQGDYTANGVRSTLTTIKGIQKKAIK